MSNSVFVIAEIGVNHDGSLERALELVAHAKAAGADAVKLQIFQADSLMHDSCAFAEYQRQRVSETSAAAMLKRYELSEAEMFQVVNEIRSCGMVPLATPFSPDDVETIEELDLPGIKVASPDLVNRVLLERAARTSRPMLLSTGAATMDEVTTTVGWLRDWNVEFSLLHCVSSYPVSLDQAHLSWIGELKQFGVPVGYSDHTTEPLAGALAVAAGAKVVEKHLTYDRNASGPDHSASADPEQFAEYVAAIRNTEMMLGIGGKRLLDVEADVRRVSRQSLVLKRDVRAGQKLSQDDLTVQRPGTGIPSAEVTVAAGRVLRRAVKKGTLLQWDMLAA